MPQQPNGMRGMNGRGCETFRKIKEGNETHIMPQQPSGMRVMNGCGCETFRKMDKDGQGITSTSTSQDCNEAWVAHFPVLELFLFLLIKGEFIPEVRSFGERKLVRDHFPVDWLTKLLHD